MPKNASSVQIFRFDPQFLPIGYTKKSGSIPVPQIQNFPAIAGWTISCQYMIKELSCDAESSEGHKATTSIAAKLPYVFTGEFYDLDFAWFMTGVVHLASRYGAKDGIVNVYALTDGAKVGDISLRPDTPMKIVFAGEETAEVMGKAQVVKKFEWGSNDFPVLRVTAQGLVASLTRKSDPAIGFEVSNYKEYEAWGTPFTSLPPRGSSDPVGSTDSTAEPGPSKPVKVASGVMTGLLVHRVPPVYPESAKQNQIQGKVVLHAVITKEGRISALQPISGAPELIAAAVSAVQQWQYKAYLVSGRAAEVDTQIVVNFTLSP